ncbi:hypothetical protein HOH45_00600 [bacterium]|mgnify:FL=1|jgi:hypothetical protein|nr:hypothetical protein [bacterium]
MEEVVYGLYNELDKVGVGNSEITMDFVIPLELMSEWERCGLISDYLARYEAFTFDDQELATQVLSTVINELLENAVKFSTDKNKIVNITIKHFGSFLSVEAVNNTDEKHALNLESYITKLKESSPEDFFFAQIEKNALVQSHNLSGLGLLTLVNDYEAKLGIKIQKKIKTGYDIFTMVLFFTNNFSNS